MSFEKEISKRRTFAIISHPDAGKTTLTEKLLLYSGMIRTAGMVRGRKGRQGAKSDWMAMEADRGISITASAMQFNYKDAVVNVLDTPGHQDFSEDTYRTLTAADSAIMVIDAAKGVEAQTRKLFSVCRMHNIPILTFVNKMDMPGRECLDLLSELEELLGIDSCPMNWPIGYAKEFAGVYDIRSKNTLMFSKAVGGADRAEQTEVNFEDLKDTLSERVYQNAEEEIELIKEAGTPYDGEQFLSGQLTPVFFGSALTNFGIEPFFDWFVDNAPSPRPRDVIKGSQASQLDPNSDKFSGFVFKIQANMDPKHRDSMAFIRIVSGKFERESSIIHHQSEKEVKLSRTHSMFGGSRTTLDEAFAGDIVGVVNPGLFSIGDTVSTGIDGIFKPMPQFPPEVVAKIRPADVSKRKAFDKGVKQLSTEGAVQLLFSLDNPDSEPYVAAVGKLQFEVLQHRLEKEYSAKTQLEVLPYSCGAWLNGEIATFDKPMGALLAKDLRERIIVLFRSDWEKRYAVDNNPNHELRDFVN